MKIMRKNRIRLTESDLRRIVNESVMRVLKESGDTRRGAYMKGRALGRRLSKLDIPKSMDDYDIKNPYAQIGAADQYAYEKSSGGKRDERMDDIIDRYERLKHDDKFFDDWQKHIDAHNAKYEH